MTIRTTERQAKDVLAALGKRMTEAGLQLHPDKTRIVFCKDGNGGTRIGAQRKYKRLRPFKKARRWWHELTVRQPRLLAHWAWMNEF